MNDTLRAPQDPLTKNGLELAHAHDGVIHLHKFSGRTSPSDVQCAGLPPEMLKDLTPKNVHMVWRCKLGQNNVWFWGWSAEEALRKALGGK